MGTGGQISLLADRALDAEEIETRPFNEKSYLIVGSSLCGGRAYATLASFFAACLRHGVPFAEIRAVSNRIGERDRSRWDIPLALSRLQAALETLRNI